VALGIEGGLAEEAAAGTGAHETVIRDVSRDGDVIQEGEGAGSDVQGSSGARSPIGTEGAVVERDGRRRRDIHPTTVRLSHLSVVRSDCAIVEPGRPGGEIHPSAITIRRGIAVDCRSIEGYRTIAIEPSPGPRDVVTDDHLAERRGRARSDIDSTGLGTAATVSGSAASEKNEPEAISSV
jgi:hypothetical protein